MINEEKFYTPKLRVLVLSPNLLAGGAERWLADLIRHSITVQYVRVLAVEKDGNTGPLLTVGCPVTIVDGEGETSKAVKAVTEQYDVILYWGLRGVDLRWTGKPVIHVVHFSAKDKLFPDDEWLKWSLGQTNANYLACVSQSGVESFPASKRSKTQVKVIHNGVDVERTRPIHGRDWQRKQWGLSDNRVACLFMGRLSPEKGPERLIGALQYLPEEYVAVVHGWGAMASELRKVASHVPGRVIFPQPRLHALGDVYGAADVVVMPSNAEAFPIVMLEAWQAGVPVVASRFATVDELEQKYARKLVESIACLPTAEDVANGILATWTDEGLQERIGFCLQMAITDYSASAMCGKWETYFYEIQRQWMDVSQYGVVEVIQ